MSSQWGPSQPLLPLCGLCSPLCPQPGSSLPALLTLGQARQLGWVSPCLLSGPCLQRVTRGKLLNVFPHLATSPPLLPALPCPTGRVPWAAPAPAQPTAAAAAGWGEAQRAPQLPACTQGMCLGAELCCGPDLQPQWPEAGPSGLRGLFQPKQVCKSKPQPSPGCCSSHGADLSWQAPSTCFLQRLLEMSSQLSSGRGL